MRYYVVRINNDSHTKEYRMFKTRSKWTRDKDRAYPFSTYETAKMIADRETQLLYPSLRSVIRYVVKEAPPER